MQQNTKPDSYNAGQRLDNKQIERTDTLPPFRHRSLRERAAEFGGELNLTTEEVWDIEPMGDEVW